LTPVRFLDTNILVRHIAGDDVVQSPQSTALMERIAVRQFQGLVSMTVLFETVHVLSSIYQLDRISISEALLAVVGTPGVVLLECEEAHFENTVSLFMSIPRLSFADCYHAVLALAYCSGEFFTFDKEFRRVPGITRLEPGSERLSP